MSDLGVQLARGSPVPLYYQLARQLEEAIETGRVSKGTFLDNELELAEQWQVSRPTVRRAIQELVNGGLLVRRRGVGTQVANDQIRRPLRLSSLYDDLIDENRHPGTRLLAHRRVVADAEVAEALSVAAGTEVVFLERCRSAGSIKLAILRNWLTVTAAGELTREELEAKGLYSLIRARGVWPHFAMQRIGAVAATSGDAAILGLAAGAPLVTMRRVMQDDTGRPVELGKHVYDATHYSVEMSVLKA